MISRRSPIPPNSTVCSPTMSPARIVWMPISASVHAPDDAVAGIHPGLFQAPAQGVGDDLAQLDGGAAGGVFLQAVMRLDDLHVVAVAQHPGNVRHHLNVS